MKANALLILAALMVSCSKEPIPETPFAGMAKGGCTWTCAEVQLYVDAYTNFRAMNPNATRMQCAEQTDAKLAKIAQKLGIVYPDLPIDSIPCP